MGHMFPSAGPAVLLQDLIGDIQPAGCSTVNRHKAGLTSETQCCQFCVCKLHLPHTALRENDNPLKKEQPELNEALPFLGAQPVPPDPIGPPDGKEPSVCSIRATKTAVHFSLSKKIDLVFFSSFY